MPIWVASLMGGLVQVAGTLVGRVLLALGVSFLSYQGIDTSLTWLSSQIASAFAGLPAQVVSVLSAAGVGSALGIVMSALAARLVLDSLTSGKKMVFK